MTEFAAGNTCGDSFRGPYSGGVLGEVETFCFILEVGIGEKIAIRGFLMG